MNTYNFVKLVVYIFAICLERGERERKRERERERQTDRQRERERERERETESIHGLQCSAKLWKSAFWKKYS